MFSTLSSLLSVIILRTRSVCITITPAFYARIAQRILVDFARLLRAHSSAI